MDSQCLRAPRGLELTYTRNLYPDKRMFLLALQLPARDDALRLANAFCQHSWLCGGVFQYDVHDDLFDIVYPFSSPKRTTTATDLALLFSIFALGTYLDTSQPHDSVVASRYCNFARLALSFDDVVLHPTVGAVRAMASTRFFGCFFRSNKLEQHLLICAMSFLTLDFPPERKAAFRLEGVITQMCKTVRCSFSLLEVGLNVLQIGLLQPQTNAQLEHEISTTEKQQRSGLIVSTLSKTSLQASLTV